MDAGVAGAGPGTMRCFNCGQPGHRANECPMARPPSAAGMPFPGAAGPRGIAMLGMGVPEEPCMRCGKRGHRTVECLDRVNEV